MLNLPDFLRRINKFCGNPNYIIYYGSRTSVKFIETDVSKLHLIGKEILLGERSEDVKIDLSDKSLDHISRFSIYKKIRADIVFASIPFPLEEEEKEK